MAWRRRSGKGGGWFWDASSAGVQIVAGDYPPETEEDDDDDEDGEDGSQITWADLGVGSGAAVAAPEDRVVPWTDVPRIPEDRIPSTEGIAESRQGPKPPAATPLANLPVPGPPPGPKPKHPSALNKTGPPGCGRPMAPALITPLLQTADTQLHQAIRAGHSSQLSELAPTLRYLRQLSELAFAKAPESAVADSDRGTPGSSGVPGAFVSGGSQAQRDVLAGTSVTFTTGAITDEPLYDVAFFERHPTSRMGSIRDHKAALTYFHHKVLESTDIPWNNETADQFPTLTISLEQLMDTRKIYYHTLGDFTQSAGRDFVFDMSPEGVKPYHGASLLAHLTPESLRYAVNGPQGRSGGVVKLMVEPRHGTYDHNRTVQQPDGTQARLPIWDFVVYRADRSTLCLHPARNETTISCMEGAVEPAPIPESGVGKSDGLGTHQRMTREWLRTQTKKTLHFRHPIT